MSSMTPPLEEYIGDCIGRHDLSKENAFTLLYQARLLENAHLESRCLRYIEQNAEETLAAEGFTEIDLGTLLAVLERDSLRVREATLFDAVVQYVVLFNTNHTNSDHDNEIKHSSKWVHFLELRSLLKLEATLISDLRKGSEHPKMYALLWSEAECRRQHLPPTAENKRSVLGRRAVGLIRFPLMSVEEFAVGAAQSGLLDDREVVSLFLYFIVNLDPVPTSGFLTVPRYCTNNRFQQVSSRWGYSGATDRIRFVVDQSIFVVGFGLFGSLDGPKDYELSMQLVLTETGGVCARNETTFKSDGSRSTFRVMFQEAVEIRPDTSYTAAALIKGPDTHYGSEGIRNVVTECPSDINVTFKFSCAEGENNFTSVSIGQIPEILFYI